MDTSAYAGLLAQVIPVVLLAVIVEYRGAYEAWRIVGTESRKKMSPDQGRRLANQFLVILAVQTIFLSVLTVLEMAALVVAGSKAGSHKLAESIINSDATLTVVSIGIGLTIAMQALSVAQSYQRAGMIEDSHRRHFHWVIRIAVVIVVFGTGLLLKG
ncbi:MULTISPECIES: hypothetical protein [Microbispora]|uniref:Uncharacterized protein n=1 Tax=Microbispora siamensis TaxID=564413 RepID=A0ABQ4GQC8_9ACTN|nr:MULTISPECIES: hypothetical protein [Microbispora]OPG07335.1 hypothetical protein B1L11_30830 [Microbispora sp. GKU 823]GIH63641.1 hypothetical protein Msi02_44580 [Microbispora siamensis]